MPHTLLFPHAGSLHAVVPEPLFAQTINGREVGDWILAVAIFAVAVVVSQIAKRLIFRTGERRGTQPHALNIVARFAVYVILIGGLVYALTAIGVDLAPILGLVGIFGLAIALAVQDIFANFIAGLILLLRRPFKAGDEIVSGDFEGVVEDINLRVTQIRQPDGVAVLIPNGEVLASAIVNNTQRPIRRTTIGIGVGYDTDLESATGVLVAAAASVDEVVNDPAPSAFVHEFGDSSINYAVNFWHTALAADEWAVRHEVAIALKRALDEAGVEIPFPQRVVISGDS